MFGTDKIAECLVDDNPSPINVNTLLSLKQLDCASMLQIFSAFAKPSRETGITGNK